jgi:phosphoribosyl 1,2-cyclic phosphodiesterase
MHDPGDFFVKFWGVRGSIASADPGTSRYGGNTSSLEVRCGGRLLLFDGGTGLRYLGRELSMNGPIDADMFLTHTHFDHIAGIPFFGPFFNPRNKFRVHAGHLLPAMTVKQALCDLMMAPLFPVPPEIFGASMEFHDFHAGETLQLSNEIRIRTAPLNHPNGATGYRIEWGGKAICYCTDTEHTPGKPDENILSLIEDADIFIYDCMYTDEEYPCHVGWGHSTWQEGVRLAEAANVKTFVAFHHDPDHNDDFMDGVQAELDKRRPGSVVAREGMVLRP